MLDYKKTEDIKEADGVLVRRNESRSCKEIEMAENSRA